MRSSTGRICEAVITEGRSSWERGGIDANLPWGTSCREALGKAESTAPFVSVRPIFVRSVIVSSPDSSGALTFRAVRVGAGPLCAMGLLMLVGATQGDNATHRRGTEGDSRPPFRKGVVVVVSARSGTDDGIGLVVDAVSTSSLSATDNSQL